jgi:hypothetical protein
MKLYLVRHATASDIATSDAERELTREGGEEARIVGAALAELGVKPSRVWSSPLVRARQTAEIVAQITKFRGEVELLDELTNGTSTPALLKVLQSYPPKMKSFSSATCHRYLTIWPLSSARRIHRVCHWAKGASPALTLTSYALVTANFAGLCGRSNCTGLRNAKCSPRSSRFHPVDIPMEFFLKPFEKLHHLLYSR